MSSGHLSEVLRSSTFRRALAAAGLVWLVCGTALVAVERLAFRAVVGPLVERVEEETDETLFEIAEELMFEEVPEHLHDALEEAIEEDRWEELAKSPDRLTGDDVAMALEDLEVLEDEYVCVELRSDAGEVLLSNLGETSAPIRLHPDPVFHFQTATPARLAEDWDEAARRCLVREVRLADGTLLRFGTVFEAHGALLRMTWIRNAGLLLGLGLALVSSYLRAGRTVRLLGDLARTGQRLGEGAFDARIRRSGDGGDFDRAVTAINTMLDRVEDSMSTVSQITDNIAHDLRTPLTRLQGQLDLLKRHSQRSDEMIEAVQDEANQLLATFNALMQIARVRSGSRRLSFRTFDMARVVTDVGELYAPVFAEAGLAFECAVPPSEVRVIGDSDLWMQALSNLLDNALKYTVEGRVRLDLRRAADAFVVELRDTGPGIPETEAENVFQRFYRLPQHRRQRGHGLGLTLVAAICDLHGAKIELENDGGLVVRIRTPSL